MSKGSSTPQVPTAGENMSDTIAALLENEGALRQYNLMSRLGDIDALATLSPAYANVMLGFEEQFGPQLRAAESEATRQTRAGDILNIADLGPAFQQAISAANDPMAEQMRNELGQQVFGELQQGTQMDDQLRREVEQGVRRAQGSRGIMRGSAPVSAEAFTVGSKGLQLRQQRQQAADNFLRQTAATRPDAAGFITGRGGVQQANPALAPQQMPNQFGQMFDATQQASNLQSQLSYNSQQANKGGGLGGAIGGGLAGYAIGGPIGAGLGALGGFL